MEVLSFARRGGRVASFVLVLALISCGGGVTGLPVSSSSALASSAPSAAGAPPAISIPQLIAQGDITSNCPAPAAGHAACGSFLITAAGKQAFASSRSASQRQTASAPSSILTPAQLLSAYGLTQAAASMGAGRTVAAIVAYDSSTLESDLGVYRSTFGLSACTTANGCFRKTDEQGGTNYPAQDVGWGGEMTFDVSMISAMCPNCHILVVEANSDSFSDLATAVNTAANLGASVINNSYGVPEMGMSAYASSYNHPGIPIVAAAGNGVGAAGATQGTQGFGSVQNVPAAYSTVIAVGETYMQADGSARGWGEYAYWNSSSGCSATVSKPSWQHDSLCSTRTVADVSFSASCVQTPSLGFYDSAVGGWVASCGSSGASAAIAGIVGLAGTVANNASFLYTGASSLTDIVSGTNGSVDSSGLCIVPSGGSTGVNYFSKDRRAMSGVDMPSGLCNAETGYDAPTGNGAPKGVTAFITTTATPVPTSTPSPVCTVAPAGSPNPHPTQNTNVGGCTS